MVPQRGGDSLNLQDICRFPSFAAVDERRMKRDSRVNLLKSAFISIKYLDVGPQAQLPPPYAEDISALLTMALIDRAL